MIKIIKEEIFILIYKMYVIICHYRRDDYDELWISLNYKK